MSLLIKNGEIITAAGSQTADIFCENETITRIGPNLSAPPGTETIDAGGKYVFPGFIDPHVHVYLPFMGAFAKDTWETASRAALIGGTTTLIEMCCPARADDALAGFELWLGHAAGKSACDFSFHMGVTRFDDQTESQLREIVKRGISSFKIFLAYKGAFGIDDSELYPHARSSPVNSASSSPPIAKTRPSSPNANANFSPPAKPAPPSTTRAARPPSKLKASITS